jgi:two-component system, response regulator PdtaR
MQHREWIGVVETSLSAVILVVEDEPFVRMDAIETLEGAGYRVIEAANADEAIAILEQRDDISLVLTDIQMPGSMDGLKLAATIHNRWPPIALIVTSGRNFIPRRDLPEYGQFLPKPYNESRLVEAIRAAL